MMVFVTEVSNCQVASVGLQGSSASGLPPLGRVVHPRHEVPFLDREITVTAAMPFLKPGVHGCGSARLSGMQYFSTSCVAQPRAAGSGSARLTSSDRDSCPPACTGQASLKVCVPRCFGACEPCHCHSSFLRSFHFFRLHVIAFNCRALSGRVTIVILKGRQEVLNCFSA